MQEHIQNPVVSIIVVNYNWKKWLKKSFDSIFSQTYKNIEVIFVDNASTDNSVLLIKQEYPLVKIIESDRNWWFSYWNNLGVDLSNWELLWLLNNDTRFADNFLEKYIEEYYNLWLDILWVQELWYNGEKSKYYPTTIDYFWHPVPDKKRIDKQVFFTQWSCVLCSKKMYQDTWWLDNDFFMYCEEVDRMRRSRMMWYTIGQTDIINIYHAWWWSSSGWLSYNTFLRRNQNTLQMLLKNHRWYYLCRVLPCYFLINIGEMFALVLLGKSRIAMTYPLWWIYNRKILSSTLAKRRKNCKRFKYNNIYTSFYKGFWKLYHLLAYIQK